MNIGDKIATLSGVYLWRITEIDSAKQSRNIITDLWHEIYFWYSFEILEEESTQLEKLRDLYNMEWASREEINEVIEKKLYVADWNGKVAIYNQKRWKEEW